MGKTQTLAGLAAAYEADLTKLVWGAGGGALKSKGGQGAEDPCAGRKRLDGLPLPSRVIAGEADPSSVGYPPSWS